MGAGDDINQIESAYRSTCISKADHGFSYGDREEFDSIEDTASLEDRPHTDYHHGANVLAWATVKNLFLPAPDHAAGWSTRESTLDYDIAFICRFNEFKSRHIGIRL